MDKNTTIFTENFHDVVKLLSENELKTELGEAFASVMINPTVTWAKFILTDDRKNANGERVPRTEFANLLRSGIFMPVKMALGEISPGHPNTKPLGTITHLKEISTDDGSSAIVAIAALWAQERPADVEFIKQRFAERLPVDVSWEILYEDAVYNSEAGCMDLNGTILRAATIVGNPAYQGRTPFLSIAATKKSDAESSQEDSVKDQETTMEEDSMEINELEAKLAELSPKLEEATSTIEQLQASLSEKEAEIVSLKENLASLDAENISLKEFKASIEAAAARDEKLNTIKTKFIEAGIAKDEAYFSENAEKFLKMDDDSLSFMIQEIASNLSEASKQMSTASKKKVEIPALVGNDIADSKDIKTLAKYLREQGKK